MEKQNKKKKTTILMVIALLLCLALAIYFVIASIKNREDARIAREAQAMEGFLPGMTQEEIDAELARKVEESQLAISINSVLEFESGTSEGLVRIENSKNNHYMIVVTMELTSTKEVIYQSGGIEPGHYLEKDHLDVALPKGEYPVLVRFKAYDPKTDQLMGEADANATVKILN